MTSRIISQTSIFPSSQEVVFNRLKQLRTLQYIAAPLATFAPVDGVNNLTWRAHEQFAFHFKLFGILPLGVHTIQVLEFDEASCQVYTKESNKHVPTWNHRIILKSTSARETQYTDEVEIDAGWKTPFVCLWAKFFYAHRQRKWVKLLRRNPAE